MNEAIEELYAKLPSSLTDAEKNAIIFECTLEVCNELPEKMDDFRRMLNRKFKLAIPSSGIKKLEWDGKSELRVICYYQTITLNATVGQLTGIE